MVCTRGMATIRDKVLGQGMQVGGTNDALHNMNWSSGGCGLGSHGSAQTQDAE